MPDTLSKVDVAVATLAKPVPQTLLAARTAIRTVPELQDLFRQARTEGRCAAALAEALGTHLPEYLLDPVDLSETCLYLADEFFQMGDHTLLISAQTGQAVARVTEADLYLPAPVARETGELAQPLPRLRPDLEGLIVQWQFDRAQDRVIVGTLAQRLPSSELLAQEGDPRLLRATLDGRRRIVAGLDGELAELLAMLATSSSKSGELLRLCKFGPTDEVPESYLRCAPRMGLARVVTSLVDPLTFNLRQDSSTVLRSQIGAQWVRDIALGISALVGARGPKVEASVLDALPNGFWIADPDTTMALRGRRALPVAGATTTLIHTWVDAPSIFLTIRPESYACRSREFLARWEVAASFEYTLHLNPDAFTAYSLKDVPESGLAVEVVS